jgi:hypothetical protein
MGMSGEAGPIVVASERATAFVAVETQSACAGIDAHRATQHTARMREENRNMVEAPRQGECSALHPCKADSAKNSMETARHGTSGLPFRLTRFLVGRPSTTQK